ncbi:nucleotidyltransferase domain-containing protein [Candidatus Woesearchaeota archaeon]|nr:nucleotidyltransferase domain-containing protein [Candidatus Woesearchaeota archaeon]
MISQIFTQDCFKVIILFSLSPGSRFNRTEIKNRTFLHNVPLDKALLRLLSSEVLKKERNYYSVNFENENAKNLLNICTWQYKQLRELPLAVFYLLIDSLYELSLIKGIEVYLFGSYAKLVYRENSDIDVALLYNLEIPREKIMKIFNTLEKIYGKKVELHYFKKAEFYKNKKDPLVKNILKDGIFLGRSRI